MSYSVPRFKVTTSVRFAAANCLSKKKGRDTSPLVPRYACVSLHFLRSLIGISAMLTAALCPHAASAYTMEIDMVLDTGVVERSYVPVDVEVPLGQHVSETHVSRLFASGEPLVSIKEGNATVPGQVERVFGADGAVAGLRLSWILKSAGPGKEKRYVARINTAQAPAVPPRFHFKDTPGKHLDCLFGDRPVYRYVYEFDPDRHYDTFKPFHHVYDFDGTNFITNGAGGKHDNHHRGMYIGWSEVKVGNNTYNLWAMSDKSYQRHARFVDRESSAGPVLARRVAVIDWMNPDGKPLVRERRETVVYKQPRGRHLFDMIFRLETLAGPIEMPGANLHHAGFHFRAAEEVAYHRRTTRYVIPEGSRRIRDSVDGPWCVQSPVVLEKRYAIHHMDHPSNPRPTVYSTRQYGRFGAFFPTSLEPGKPLHCRYRVSVSLVKDGARLERERFEIAYANYTQPPAVRVVGIKVREAAR